MPEFTTTSSQFVYPVSSPAQISASAQSIGSPIRWSPSAPGSAIWNFDADTRYVGAPPPGFDLRQEIKRVVHLANHRIVYQIITDRFLRGDGLPVLSKRNYRSYWGGNFPGVEAALPYLQRLGVNAIWLSPVQACPEGRSRCERMSAYHGYWPKDWYRLNGHFTGSGHEEPLSGLAPLVSAAHRHGIEVFFDALIHHAMPKSMPGGSVVYRDGERVVSYDEDAGAAAGVYDDMPDYFERLMRGEVLPMYNTDQWFLHMPQTRNYDKPFPHELEVGTLIDLPTLNLFNPRVQEMIFEAYRRLYEVTGARGMRIDVGKHMYPWFVEKFVAFMKEHFPELEVVGEYFDFSYLIDNTPWVSLTERNLLSYFDFALHNLIGNAFRDPTRIYKEYGHLGGGEVRYPLLRRIADYIARISASPETYQAVLRNYIYLDNHDLPRFMNIDNDVANLHKPGHRPIHPERHAQDQALLLLTCLPGHLVFYYGQEKYLRGPDRLGFWGYGSDPENRSAFGEVPGDGQPGVRWMRGLTALRAANPALTAGDIEVMEGTGDTRLVLRRRFMDNEVLYWHDRSHFYHDGHEVKLDWPDGIYRDPMTDLSYEVRGGRLIIPKVSRNIPRKGAGDVAYRTIVLTLNGYADG